MSLEGGAGIGECCRVIETAGKDAAEGGESAGGRKAGCCRKGRAPLSEKAVRRFEGT